MNLLTKDLALSQQLANLEHYLQADQLVIRHCSASLAPSEFTVRHGVSIHSEALPRPLSTDQYELARSLTFESMLKSSRVYRKVRRHSEQLSFRSSTVPSHAWSALSDVSLSDISAISVLALPLDSADINNAHHYTFAQRTMAHDHGNGHKPSSNLTDDASEGHRIKWSGDLATKYALARRPPDSGSKLLIAQPRLQSDTIGTFTDQELEEARNVKLFVHGGAGAYPD
jgi:hypothetical protein